MAPPFQSFFLGMRLEGSRYVYWGDGVGEEVEGMPDPRMTAQSEREETMSG